jgi:hypothetical protein
LPPAILRGGAAKGISRQRVQSENASMTALQYGGFFFQLLNT